jgi:hypothetical protein
LVSEWERGKQALQIVEESFALPTPLANIGAGDFEQFVRGYFQERRWKECRAAISVAHLIRAQANARPLRQLNLGQEDLPAFANILDRQRGHFQKFGHEMLQQTKLALAAEVMLF